MKSAEITGTNVVNVAEGLISGWTPCPDEVAPGWTYDGANWAAPPLPPQTDEEFNAEIKSECGRWILNTVNSAAQINLAAANLTGSLSAPDAATYNEMVLWIENCVSQCRTAARSRKKSTQQWPEPSAAVVELAKRY